MSAKATQIVLSIKPEYAERIFTTQKRYEFRRILPAREVDGMFIHVCGTGKQEVQGFARVVGFIHGTPDETWSRCANGAGISKQEYDDYFLGRDEAVAIAIESAHKFDKPMPIEELGLKSAPQGMAYVRKGAE